MFSVFPFRVLILLRPLLSNSVQDSDRIGQVGGDGKLLKSFGHLLFQCSSQIPLGLGTVLLFLIVHLDTVLVDIPPVLLEFTLPFIFPTSVSK